MGGLWSFWFRPYFGIIQKVFLNDMIQTFINFLANFKPLKSIFELNVDECLFKYQYAPNFPKRFDTKYALQL